MSDLKTYPPSPDFAKKAHVPSLDAYRALYDRAKTDPEAFWSDLAKKELSWFQPFTKGLEWNSPFAKWFTGGKINASYNCLDRHIAAGNGAKAAIIFEGEPGDERIISYQELHRLVCRFATVLKQQGYKAGDRAIVYMPMIPELPIALLACARLGITHSVVFGGFSAEALKARALDLDATLVITADGGWRRGKEVPLKGAVDEALEDCPNVRNVVVYQRTCTNIPMKAGRDLWWHELDQKLNAQEAENCPAEPLDPEHPLFVLYTSALQVSPKAFFTPPAAICCKPP